MLLAWENEAHADRPAGQGTVRDRPALPEHPGRAAGRRGGQERGQARHTRRGDGLPPVPVSRKKARPSPPSTSTARAWPSVAKQYAAQFPDIPLFDDQPVRRLATAQKTHFADGGVFDQIYGRNAQGTSTHLRRSAGVSLPQSHGTESLCPSHSHNRRVVRAPRRVLPGFGLSLGYSAVLPGADRAGAAGRRLPQVGARRRPRLLADRHRPAHAGGVPAQFRGVLRGGAGQRRLRAAGGLGAGALLVSRAADH